MSTFTFPTPAGHHNDSPIQVPEPVLVNLLCLAVEGVHGLGCPDAECPDCTNNRLSCEVAFSLLSEHSRQLVDTFLVREAHIRPGEWRR